MKTTVLETNGVTMVEYRIVGDLDGVLGEIRRLLNEYSAWDYGTHVHWLDMEVDGSYQARVSRTLRVA